MKILSRTTWMKFNAVALMTVVGYFGSAWLFQRDMMYPKPQQPDRGALPGSLGGEIVWTGGDARIENWYFPPPSAPTPSPALIYVHGNGMLIDQWAARIQPLRERGFGILLAEYPGYGRSGGEPSQDNLTASLTEAYDWLIARSEIDPKRIITHGQSLGGGASATLLNQRPIAAAVLESTFSSFRRYAQTFAIPLFLVRDPYETDQTLQRFNGPVLIMHGTKDEIFDLDNANRLHEAARTSTLITQDCGHNNCPLPWDHVVSFLQEHGIAP